MASFQKPENALKRAEELIDVGKKQNALDVLKEALNHRKWRNNWTETLERIIMRHLELCVELKKIPYAREGLHQYRGTCQAANIGSLEKVVQIFRRAAEEKVNQAKKEQEAINISKMDDLDECESPQTILLRAIQSNDTRQQSQDREVTAHFRFLWDTYRVILDVLKSNVRLEEVYHETAQHAFEFCRTNKRPQEFRRLCETLRKNYLDLSKPRTPNQHQVNPSNPETVTRTIDTRFAQLRTATELDLWREAYNTATEIYDLMNKAKTKLKTRSEYYEYLSQIFWKSENYLFHAFACLKNVLFVKAVKRDLSKEDLQIMASKAVMATLCVPFQKASDMHATLELTGEGSNSPHEKAKKHAALFSAQSVPTRDTIIAQLIEKNLLQHASEPCQRLFALIESDFTPLSLCQDAKPFLDLIESPEVCGGNLGNYITPVKKIIFFRLMKQLSEVYANMTIKNFEHAASIVPFSLAEKWMANAARAQGLSIQINYREQTIVFDATRKADLKSMRQPLIEIGYKLQQAMQRVAPEEQNKKEKLEKQALQQNIVRRIEEERGLIRQRREEIERRKEENERKKEQQEREAAEKIRKQEEKEAEAERKRQSEERAKREVEREEQKKKDAKMKETKEMLEAMKKQDESKPTNLKIGGKKIGDIQAEDIEGIDIMALEKARDVQVDRERKEKIRQRKLESKRVDHVSRAMREEEKTRLADWAEQIQISDTKFLDAATKRDEAEQFKNHEAGLAEKQILVNFQEQKDEWIEGELAARYEDHKLEQKDKMKAKRQEEADSKIERARKRRAEVAEKGAKAAAEEKKAEEDKKRKAQERREAEKTEEERIEREEREAEEAAAEQARKKEERAARDAQRAEENEARDRADQKRRDKEREIEERLAGGGKKEEEVRRPAAGGGGGWRDREAAKQTGGGERDAGGGDDWRSGGAARGGDRDAGGGDNWRRGNDRQEAPKEAPSERPVPAWKRAAAKASPADDEGGWRKPAAAAEPAPREEKKPAWGRRDDDEERKPPARREEPKAAAADDDDGFETVPKGKKGKAKEPEPAAEEEDDGFAVVQKGKKKDAPWRTKAADGEASRDDWKNKGKEEEAAPARSAPWRKN